MYMCIYITIWDIFFWIFVYALQAFLETDEWSGDILRRVEELDGSLGNCTCPTLRQEDLMSFFLQPPHFSTEKKKARQDVLGSFQGFEPHGPVLVGVQPVTYGYCWWAPVPRHEEEVRHRAIGGKHFKWWQSGNEVLLFSDEDYREKLPLYIYIYIAINICIYLNIICIYIWSSVQWSPFPCMLDTSSLYLYMDFIDFMEALTPGLRLVQDYGIIEMHIWS